MFDLKKYKKMRWEERKEEEIKRGKKKEEFYINLNNKNKINFFSLIVFF